MPKVDKYKAFRDFNFKVEADGVNLGGFQDVSGLRMQVDTLEYQEGGVNDHVHQLPGQFSHENLVLKHGMTNETVLWDWIKDVKSGGIAKNNARKNVRVKLLSGYKSKQMWGWEFRKAYPIRWDGPEMSGTTSGSRIAIEELELAHKGFSKITSP